MSKFGELIDKDIPVILMFFTGWNEQSVAMHPVMRDLAATYGDEVNVVKIDTSKNGYLSEALRIKGLPTIMIYFKGEQVWRKSGELTLEEMRRVVDSHIN